MVDFRDNIIKLLKNKEIDLNSLKGGINIESLKSSKSVSVFLSKLDLDSNGIIDNAELAMFLDALKEGAGDDNCLSEDESAQLLKTFGFEKGNKSDIANFLNQIQIASKNIKNCSTVNLEDGREGVVVTFNPNKKGITTTLIYDKSTGLPIQFNSVDRKNQSTTIYYNSDNSIKYSEITNKKRTITYDYLHRVIKEIKKVNGKEVTSEYEYVGESYSVKKVVQKSGDGSTVIDECGQKVRLDSNGTSKTEASKITKSNIDYTKAIQKYREVSTKQTGTSNVNVKEQAKQIASDLATLFYENPPSKNRAEKIKQIITMINSANVDWVIYHYKQLKKGDLFTDLNRVFKNDVRTANQLQNKLFDVQYSKYGVKPGYQNTNSQVSNKYHKGAKFSVIRTGPKIYITNVSSGEKRIIDLNILLKNYANAKDRAKLIKTIETLPGEVLMDMAVEVTSLIPAGEDLSVTVDGASVSAAGSYSGKTDTLNIKPDTTARTLVHELGHAVDYNKVSGKNRSSVLNDQKLQKLFNEEMRQFIAAGNKQYTFNSKPASPRSTYCTANEKEMFAECYTLLMTGNCGSKDVLEKYFPKTLNYINQLVANNRSQGDKIRHFM